MNVLGIATAVLLSASACTNRSPEVPKEKVKATPLIIEESPPSVEPPTLLCPNNSIARDLRAGKNLSSNSLPMHSIGCVSWKIKGQAVLLTAQYQQNSGEAGRGCYASVFEFVHDGKPQQLGVGEPDFEVNPCSDSDSSAEAFWSLDETGRAVYQLHEFTSYDSESPDLATIFAFRLDWSTSSQSVHVKDQWRGTIRGMKGQPDPKEKPPAWVSLSVPKKDENEAYKFAAPKSWVEICHQQLNPQTTTWLVCNDSDEAGLIGPAELSLLAQWPKLTSLSLSYASFEDLAPLSQLKDLKTLRLDKYSVDDSSLAPIAKLQNLESLSLATYEDSPLDLRPLAKLPNLKRLTVSGSKVKGANMFKDRRDFTWQLKH